MPKPPALAAPVPQSRILPSHRVPSFLSYLLRQVCLGIMAEVLAPADGRAGRTSRWLTHAVT